MVESEDESGESSDSSSDEEPPKTKKKVKGGNVKRQHVKKISKDEESKESEEEPSSSDPEESEEESDGTQESGDDDEEESGDLAAATGTMKEATDLDGAKRETQFAVTIRSNVQSFVDWQTSFSFTEPEDALANNDPDRDGWINLLEYVLVTDPLNPTHPDPRMEALENGNLRFSIRKNVPTNVRVESSIDLISWATIWESSQGRTGPGVIGYQSQNELAVITLDPMLEQERDNRPTADWQAQLFKPLKKILEFK